MCAQQRVQWRVEALQRALERQAAVITCCILSTIIIHAQVSSSSNDEDRVYRIGEGVTSPQPLPHPDPALPGEARRALVNSSVDLSFVVGKDGIPADIRVERGAGFGLDETAIANIATRRFLPGQKNGHPVRVRCTMELSFRIFNKEREQQFARLQFNLPAGVPRPILVEGTTPENPTKAGQQSVRVALSVNPDGRIVDAAIVDATDSDWAKQTIQELKGWRFRSGGSRVEGTFEVEQQPKMINLSSNQPEDVSLPAPKLLLPLDGETFDRVPRRTTFSWEPSSGAVRYLLEYDYSAGGRWQIESSNARRSVFVAEGTEYSFNFVGAQPGRWRIWPVSKRGKQGVPSEWRTFRYSR